LFFQKEDNDFIYLYEEYDHDTHYYRKRKTIIIDKGTQNVKATVVENISNLLSLVERGGKYGLWQNGIGLLTSVSYDKIQIKNNIIYARNRERGYLLYKGQVLLKEFLQAHLPTLAEQLTDF
jgi:hypothetical protein